MREKLTHEEACGLVEDAMERVLATLVKVRATLGDSPKKVDEMKVTRAIDRANLLCNVNYYGAYLKGAKAMYRTLKDHCYLDIPRPKDYVPLGTPKEERVINAAQLDCYMASSRNLDWFLHGAPGSVSMRIKTEKDKKGKVVKATASFCMKETVITEI